jgi:quinol monooxygenase YgiN
MYARIVECRVRPDKRDDFARKLENDVMPILKKQPGFVDTIGMISETEGHHIVAISFWQRKEDAEGYAQQHFSEVLQVIKPLIDGEPRVETFQVATSAGSKILSGHAA